MTTLDRTTDPDSANTPEDGPSPLELAHAAQRMPASALDGPGRASLAARKAALLSLADHAGTGWWALGIARIAGETGHSERTARRALTELSDAGWVYRDRMRLDDGSEGVYAWAVNVPAILAHAPARASTGPAAATGPPGTVTGPPGHHDRTPPDTVAARPGGPGGGPLQEDPPERACAREPAEPVAAEAGGSPDGQGNPDPGPERGDGSCGESPAEPDTGRGGYDVAAFVAALTVASVTAGALRGDARAVAAFDQADAEGIPPRALAHAVEAEWPANTRSPVGLVCYRLPGAVERLAPEYRPPSPAPTPETCSHDRIAYDTLRNPLDGHLPNDECIRCGATWTPRFVGGVRMHPVLPRPLLLNARVHFTLPRRSGTPSGYDNPAAPNPNPTNLPPGKGVV